MLFMDESLNQSKDQATLVMPMISCTCTCCSFSDVKGAINDYLQQGRPSKANNLSPQVRLI